MSRARRLLVWAAATDRTFELADLRGRPVLAGKCIHCNTKLVVDLEGREISQATVEHILPRTHGGDDSLENLAVACARCNGQKGVRLDPRRRDDPTLDRVISLLRERRRERMRPPPDGLLLPRIDQGSE